MKGKKYEERGKKEQQNNTKSRRTEMLLLDAKKVPRRALLPTREEVEAGVFGVRVPAARKEELASWLAREAKRTRLRRHCYICGRITIETCFWCKRGLCRPAYHTDDEACWLCRTDDDALPVDAETRVRDAEMAAFAEKL